MSYYAINTSINDLTILVSLKSRSQIQFRFVTNNTSCQHIALLWKYRYELNALTNIENATAIAKSDNYIIYELTINVEKLDIHFIVEVGDQNINWYSEIGKHNSKDEAFIFSYIIPNIKDQEIHKYIPQHPNWIKGCTLYQIFVDRYKKHTDSEDFREWNLPPLQNDFYHTSHYGGSLQGITDSIKSQYLNKLGIGGIYLTPLFSSDSNHKYDTKDYFSIDSHFGTTNDLQSLVQTAHNNNITVILDIAFNHSSDNLVVHKEDGSSIEIFKDIKKRYKDSLYYNWAIWISDKKWKGFAGLNHIPILNTNNKECMDYLLNVAQYWLEHTKIDGFRLDVANEIGETFISELNTRLERQKPWLLGEILHNGNKWIAHNKLSSVTNHHWRDIVILFLKEEYTSEKFDEYLQLLWLRYPESVYAGIVNYLSNHDCERIITAINKGQNYEIRISLVIIATILLFTSYGVPTVYYGDEIAMEGERDPDCRKAMEWDTTRWNQEQIDLRLSIKNLYTKLIHLRKKMSWLNEGTWETLIKGRNALYCYKRHSKKTNNNEYEEVIVITNPSNCKFNVNLSPFCRFNKYHELISGKIFKLDDLDNINIDSFKSIVLISKQITS